MLSLRLVKSSYALAKTSSQVAPKARKLVISRSAKAPQSFARFYASDNLHNATKLKLTLQTPSESIYLNHECTTVGVPGSVGEFAIAPNSSPAFAELAPGVVRVIDGTTDLKYFVSGGFVASHEDSTVNISVGECIKLDDIDIDAARKIASASQARMTSASSEEDKAIAQIGFDTATAMIKAYESK
jgi:F-type H+-transporting ATPase subunit delta